MKFFALRILKTFFLFHSLLGIWGMTVKFANFSEKYYFSELINIAWENKFSDFVEIARELPGTT